jgi:prevent-host-death family protein
MREIQLSDAGAALSSAIDAAACGEPSLVVRHGKLEAVVISFEEWRRLSASAPSFARPPMSAPVEPGDLPGRDRSPLRETKF